MHHRQGSRRLPHRGAARSANAHESPHRAQKAQEIGTKLRQSGWGFATGGSIGQGVYFGSLSLSETQLYLLYLPIPQPFPLTTNTDIPKEVGTNTINLDS